MKPDESVLNVGYLEQMYTEYLQDPHQVPESWRQYFAAAGNGDDRAEAAPRGPSFVPSSIFRPTGGGNGSVTLNQLRLARLQERVDQLIRNYRVRGHIIAKIDPLGRHRTSAGRIGAGLLRVHGRGPGLPGVDQSLRGSNVQTSAGGHPAAGSDLLRGDRLAVHAHRRLARLATGCSAGSRMRSTDSS